MKTLLLDTALWDLTVDAAGNIALASEPYALAQDVASAVKTFLKDVYYNQTEGIDYFAQILGKTPPLQLFKQLMVEAALTVPGVVTATCELTAFEGREVTGQILFTDTSGSTGQVSF